MSQDEREAFVVRLQDYRDKDRLVWLVTRDLGRVHAIARGARGSRHRFGGHLDVLQRVRVRLSSRAGASLHTLLDCQAIESYPRLRADVRRFAAGNLVAELAHQLAREGSADEELYASLGDALAHLADSGRERTREITAAGVVRLLSVSGFVPDLGGCGACDGPLETGGRLNPAHGLFCERCAVRARGGVPLGAEESAALATWQRLGVAGATEASGPGAISAAFALMRHALGRPLRSEPFFEEVFHS